MENVKMIAAKCYELIERSDTLKDITEVLFDNNDSTYHYGMGFSDGFKEASTNILNEILNCLTDEMNNDRGNEKLN